MGTNTEILNYLLYYPLLSLVASFLFLHVSRQAEDSHLQEVMGKIDELKYAAESLQGISDSIHQLSEMARCKVKNSDVQPAKEAFSCLFCKGMKRICNKGKPTCDVHDITFSLLRLITLMNF